MELCSSIQLHCRLTVLSSETRPNEKHETVRLKLKMKKEDAGYLIRTISISLLQFLLWMVIFELSTWLILQFHQPRRLGPANGHGYYNFILLVWILFGIVMLGANMLEFYLNKRRSIQAIYVFLGIIYASCFVHMLNYTPYRALHIMSTGILAMLCGLPLLILLKKKQRLPNRLNFPATDR